MRIILDAFGGDNAPDCVIAGADMAAKELGVDITLCGDTQKIQQCAQRLSVDISGFEIIDAPEVFAMDDDAATIVKRKDTSMYAALNALKEQKGDALVSAGSTGGLLAGATLIVKRIKGVNRGAIATVIPGYENPFLLLDTGANAECRPEMLAQFARMGDSYAKGVMGVANPRIALLCNGTEQHKGRELEQATDKLLRASNLNYIGYAESSSVPVGGVDVFVADGFSGNVFLKTAEGFAKMMTKSLKDTMLSSTKTKIGALLLKSALGDFKKKLDPSEHGGAPILGIRAPVIKAQGSSDAKSIKNAIRQAKSCVENGVCKRIETGIAAKETDGTN